MKRRTKVTKRRRVVRGRIASLRTSAEGVKSAHDSMAEMAALYRPIKKPVTLRLDADVLTWFKKPGHGYQTRINRALRSVMMEERKESRE